MAKYKLHNQCGKDVGEGTVDFEANKLYLLIDEANESASYNILRTS